MQVHEQENLRVLHTTAEYGLRISSGNVVSASSLRFANFVRQRRVGEFIGDKCQCQRNVCERRSNYSGNLASYVRRVSSLRNSDLRVTT